ncbi:hypothetical protein [Halobaculum magnesiiphilum]|uniref:Uncharacterized protein n=1 Tax=Halobaculum magnesiiphilum TaxID=1017351 RepID=A0A8T8WIN3_9EURY|nr:hypothetical protein [Halobaculum magnesiiphilum]QZP39735.1 hypothetical protein K6T50_17310 [Halobaculum magnesiiphilum]
MDQMVLGVLPVPRGLVVGAGVSIDGTCGVAVGGLGSVAVGRGAVGPTDAVNGLPTVADGCLGGSGVRVGPVAGV